MRPFLLQNNPSFLLRCGATYFVNSQGNRYHFDLISPIHSPRLQLEGITWDQAANGHRIYLICRENEIGTIFSNSGRYFIRGKYAAFYGETNFRHRYTLVCCTHLYSYLPLPVSLGANMRGTRDERKGHRRRLLLYLNYW